MKLTIPTDALKKALARLAVIPGVLNTHIPTLAVVIEADDFAAKIRRTTANASVSVDLEADISESGECGVDYHTLTSAINAMGAAETSLAADSAKLSIKSGKTKAEIHRFPETDLLPVPEQGHVSDTLRFSTGDLVKWLKIVAPAQATESKEIKFAGVCMRVQQDHLTVFAVDRRRIHMAYIGGSRAALNPNSSKDHGHMIVSEGVSALLKLLPEHDGAIEISFGNGTVRAKAGDVDAILPLAEDQPPDMEGVVMKREPKPNNFTCNRTELLRAVRTAAPLGYQEQKIISVKIQRASVEIIADNQNGGKLGHEIDATVHGGEYHLRANAQYFTDMVDAMDGDTITMTYVEERGMIYTYSDDRLCVLMLVRDAYNSNT